MDSATHSDLKAKACTIWCLLLLWAHRLLSPCSLCASHTGLPALLPTCQTGLRGLPLAIPLTVYIGNIWRSTACPQTHVAGSLTSFQFSSEITPSGSLPYPPPQFPLSCFPPQHSSSTNYRITCMLYQSSEPWAKM